MLVEHDALAGLQVPAGVVRAGTASAEAGTFVCAFRNGAGRVSEPDVGHGEIVGVLGQMIVSPRGEYNAKIVRENAAMGEIVVYNGEFFGEREEFCVCAAPCNADHHLEIVCVGNISGGVEAKVREVGCGGDDGVLLFPRGVEV